MTGGRRIRLPAPHLGQQRVQSQAKRFNWLAAGRRWRKTTLGMAIAIEAVLKGQRIFWGAPTYDQVRIGWDEAEYAAGNVFDFKLSRMIAEAPTGGRIVFRSLDDPDNARGHPADGVLVDEAGAVKDRAWYEILRPMLADTEGWAWLKGTPLGRNWFWREHTNANDRDDSIAWQIPTVGVAIVDGDLIRQPHQLENPDIAFEEIYQIWQTIPERTFRQEILAEFIEGGGGVFRWIQESATAQLQSMGRPDHDYVFGVDWAKHIDWTVICVLDITMGELVAIDRFQQIDYSLQIGRLKALYNRFLPTTIIAERNSIGDAIIEQLQDDGLPVEPFNTTNVSKKQAIDDLALAFERRSIRILDDATLIAELQAYETKRLPSGTLRYSAPAGFHDDCVIALMLAWHGVGEYVPQLSQQVRLDITEPSESKWVHSRPKRKSRWRWQLYN